MRDEPFGGPAPDWWAWELERTPHLERRMEDRDCTEVDLRRMLQVVTAVRPDAAPGRYMAATRHGGRPWQVIRTRASGCWSS